MITTEDFSAEDLVWHHIGLVVQIDFSDRHKNVMFGRLAAVTQQDANVILHLEHRTPITVASTTRVRTYREESSQDSRLSKEEFIPPVPKQPTGLRVGLAG